MLGNPAAAEPCSSAKPGLDCGTKSSSVLTTTTETKPWPSEIVAGTGTVSWMALMVAASGLSGPSLTEPLEVLTKKLTSEPLVKPLPLIMKLASGQDRTLHRVDSRMARQRSRRRHWHGRLRRGRDALGRRRRRTRESECALGVGVRRVRHDWRRDCRERRRGLGRRSLRRRSRPLGLGRERWDRGRRRGDVESDGRGGRQQSRVADEARIQRGDFRRRWASACTRRCHWRWWCRNRNSPSNANLTLAPVTGAAGVTETSLSEPNSVTGLPTITVVGLRLRVQKARCVARGPGNYRVDWKSGLVVPRVADATIVSTPGNIAV